MFQTAFAKLDGGNSGTRIMLARIAEREDDAEKIIELLDGHVDITHDSQELRSLARAFVNAPVRQASISFINALPPDLSNQAFYARAIGSIHFNRGDLAAAASFFQEALLADSTDAAAHLGLINTWLRQDRRDLVGPHLEAIDLTRLKGPPVHKMGLAQMLVAFGQTERGLSFGYDVAIKNRTDQRAVMLYIGLFLPGPTGGRIPSVGQTIGVDCWVKAERTDGRVLTFVIDDDPNLLQIVVQDSADNLEKLEVAGAFIGNETADPASHIKVTREFFVQVWNTDLPYLRKAKATGIMLERLLGMLARLDLIKEVYLDLTRSSRDQPLLRQYLIAWARGHFLDLK